MRWRKWLAVCGCLVVIAISAGLFFGNDDRAIDAPPELGFLRQAASRTEMSYYGVDSSDGQSYAGPERHFYLDMSPPSAVALFSSHLGKVPGWSMKIESDLTSGLTAMKTDGHGRQIAQLRFEGNPNDSSTTVYLQNPQARYGGLRMWLFKLRAK